MSACILVINCGSSSIKYALIGQGLSTQIAGLAENLGTAQARIKGTQADGSAFNDQFNDNANIESKPTSHADALHYILAQLSDYQPVAIGHRVVHGGEKFTQAVQIDAQVIATIRQTSALAPLHNPANLLGIEATLALFPNLPQVAVFDTAFHQTMPPTAYRYAIPENLYTDYAVRRYGFHGTSHAYVSQRASTLAGTPDQGGWLTAHLGNGCSTCAIWNGQSMDTSMGLTPLEGVVMGTRSGDVDPGLHRFLADNLGWSLHQIDEVLNRESGLLGLSSLSNDMRTLVDAAKHGHQQAQLAVDVFCYRLAKSLAAMSCALPMLHGLIFTGGIGENAAEIRAKTIALLPHFGCTLNQQQNQRMYAGAEGRIDAGQGPQIWVIPTNEEGRIAAETRQVLGLGE
ncbi:MAG: acetate kinase [Moraxellaceae bacterium]|nr:MAG: acetate kinase [Moraxellaceae bacterium]